MTESTPTAEEVRDYIRAVDHVTAHMFLAAADSVEAFDRWLVAHDAEVQAERDAEEPSDQIMTLILDLTDPDDCSFDHHGGCQAHGYLSLKPGELCPQAEAKERLAGWVPAGQEGAET
ncbi:hypothetical protein LVJ59_16285 [Microbacterium sp. KKR3/1]|uniref:hypothetical protein n=1 Tax=Microbacterium sp. KKR3/1 TaxID=2904241 RepID=UPI001E355864|nr:hypothetical protein [Microbacterium sp. KKR3/1]MCE0510608.1 hypothetical protein [Microbacterium sp. KKR3/1]